MRKLVVGSTTIWQYGVKLEMKFHRASPRKGEESAGQTAIDGIPRGDGEWT